MGEILGDVLTGSAVAVVVALIAWFGTGHFSRRHEAARARRQRNLAAAEELYAAYGEFFAAWKGWDFAWNEARAHGVEVPVDVRQGLLEQAAHAEGRYESLIVRVSLEHRLSTADRQTLWALRFAMKELRVAIRGDKRLGWWRTDDPGVPAEQPGGLRYAAFKDLTAHVASIFVDADPLSASPTVRERSDALAAITASLSPSDAFISRVGEREWPTVATTLRERRTP